MKARKTQRSFFVFLLVGIAILVLSACGPANSNNDSSNTVAITDNSNSVDGAYPDSLAVEGNDDYPGRDIPTPEGLVPAPPDPDRDLPNAAGDFAVIGGVLIREYIDQGFVPFTPTRLVLGKVLETNTGQPAYITENEESLEAELFPTGVFVFNSVPPGTYGIVVDLSFTKFPINGDDGSPLLITIQAGDAIDLGQLFIEMPGS